MSSRLNLAKIMRAVEIKRKKDAKSWLEVTNELGFASTSTIHNMRSGAVTNFHVDRLVAILTWLGTTDFGPYLMEEYETVESQAVASSTSTEWTVWWGSEDRRGAPVHMEFDHLDGALKALKAMPGGKMAYAKITVHDWVTVESPE